MTAVHQFVPSYVGPSAIATHTQQVAAVLRELGLRTHIYVGDAAGVPTRDVSDYERYTPLAGEPVWLLYQLSIGHPMGDFLAARPEPLALNYHNITPARFFQPWEPLIAPQLSKGRRQMDRLAPLSHFGIADSAYNADELVAAGQPDTAVVPVLVDYDQLGSADDPECSAELSRVKRNGGTDWLFVGRISPNKAQHRLIQALAVYRRLYDPKARLHLVGGTSSHFYLNALQGLATRLGIGPAVAFVGSVPQTRLVSYYRHADVFVSASEHEGFGIPLIEAMWHRRPVVALASSAVPATTGPASVLLPPEAGTESVSPASLAAAVNRVMTDPALHDQLVQLGAQRAAEMSIAATRRRFAEAVTAALEKASARLVHS
jgi:glycosyltransferase involved in cell wall biosynthesis